MCQVGEEVLGIAAKVTVSKESTTIVGDGRAEASVAARVRQIKNMIAETEQDYEREKLNERVARLSGGVAVIQASRRVTMHTLCADYSPGLIESLELQSKS